MPPTLLGIKTGRMLCHKVTHVFCSFRWEPHPTSNPLFLTAWSQLVYCSESIQTGVTGSLLAGSTVHGPFKVGLATSTQNVYGTGHRWCANFCDFMLCQTRFQ